MKTLRVLLVSERRLLGEAIAAVVARPGAQRSCPVELVGVVAPEAALAALREVGSLDVVLLDAEGEPLPWVERVRELHTACSGAKLLVLGLEEHRQAIDFIEAGAAGYTLQHDSLDDVLRAAEEVAHGLAPCHPAVVGQVVARIVELARDHRSEGFRISHGRSTSSRSTGQSSLAALPQGLSARETEVLDLLAQGLRNKEIASRLDLAMSTVRNHVQKILNKFGAHRRRDAVRRAYEQGILRNPMPWPSA